MSGVCVDQCDAAVLITGAAGGIGRAAALQLARAGRALVLVDRDEAALQRLLAEWPVLAPAPRCRVLDLSDAAAVARLGDGLPPLAGLVNNAGMSAGGQEAVGGDEAAAQRLLDLNLAAPARVVQACAAQLLPGACIVNVASGAGLRAIPWRGLYSPSKAGLIAQTRALARAHPEWRVNLLVPGFVRTELVQGLIDSGRLNPAQALAKVPLGHLAEPEDMAEALCFLLSPSAQAIAGQALVLDGGSSGYGGSQALPASRQALPGLDWRLALQTHALAAAPAARPDPSGQAPHPAEPHYPARCDGRALRTRPGGWLAAVREAAADFRRQHAAQASLTLLLPPDPDPDIDWALAGDSAATRMLIATLAAEWGADGLRINALQWAPDTPLDGLWPLLQFVAGPRARCLTGQVLGTRPPTVMEAR